MDAFWVIVRPGAKKSAIMGEKDGILKVDLKAQPQDDKANKELLRLLAKEYGPVRIVSGAAARKKLIKKL